MMQTVAAYIIVAAAAAWIGWRMFLPATVRRRLRTRMTGKQCGDDCGCS